MTELETGCTCVTFDTQGKPSGCVCVCRRLPTPPADPIIACLPLRRRLTLRMPSRIRPLLHELLLVLLSIISPQTALVSTSPQSGRISIQQRRKQQQEQAQALRAVLDVDLIEQEMRHGLFDPSGAFEVVGQILKSHCAPMRDPAVDAMVQLAATCAPGSGGGRAEAVRAIRECFELLELMKLVRARFAPFIASCFSRVQQDIANHQMQTCRPLIIHTSPGFELRTFKERPNCGEAPLKITEQWLTSAHRRLVDSEYKLALPDRPLAFKTLGKRSRVILSVIEGLVDLIFNPPSPVPLTSPIVTTTSPSHQLIPNIITQLPDYPETLFLDHSRLIQLTKDAADVTSVYLLLMLYRQLLVSSYQDPSIPRREINPEDVDMQLVKKEILELAPRNIGRCFLRIRPTSDPQSSQPEARELEKWKSGMQSVVLQIASRASEARRRPSAAASSNPSLRAPEPHLLKVAESWSENNFKLEAPLSALMRDRLRDAVLEIVVQTVLVRGSISPLAPAVAGGSTQPATRKLATGMEPLALEIRQLGERLSKLAVLHLNVYQTMYEQDDFSAEW